MRISKYYGFVKLHRRLLEWEWYTDVKVCHLFIHCILRANFKDVEWRTIEIERGQFITSLRALASETGLSVQEVRTALDKLKTTGEIDVKAESNYSRITVNNYHQYQTKNNTRPTNDQHASNKQATTDKKDENDPFSF